ncbi:MAG: hypothetical protein KKD31_16365 [Bacteroidetes bacterium]|nr:hypothetical protein [Bacteroidota bacterium]
MTTLFFLFKAEAEKLGKSKHKIKSIKMTQFVIAYTIEKEPARKSIESMLNKIGIRRSVDQSTKLGKYQGTNTELIKVLESARIENQLTEKDTLVLLYAGKNINDEFTIFKKEIK